MIRSYGLFLSGITANQRWLEVAADNMANLNTVAFKRNEPVFGDLLYDLMQDKRLPVRIEPGSVAPQAGLGVRAAADLTYFQQGPLITGGRPLDLALEGEGFFRIIRADGPVYTRRGEFFLDAGSRLVTARGELLDLPFNLAGFRPETLIISPEGLASAQNASGETVTLGGITLYRFINPDGLLKDRSGHYLATTSSGAPISGAPSTERFGQLRQFSLEGSNAEIALEAVQLMMAQRALQVAARGFATADELQALALQLRS